MRIFWEWKPLRSKHWGNTGETLGKSGHPTFTNICQRIRNTLDSVGQNIENPIKQRLCWKFFSENLSKKPWHSRTTIL